MVQTCGAALAPSPSLDLARTLFSTLWGLHCHPVILFSQLLKSRNATFQKWQWQETPAEIQHAKSCNDVVGLWLFTFQSIWPMASQRALDPSSWPKSLRRSCNAWHPLISMVYPWSGYTWEQQICFGYFVNKDPFLKWIWRSAFLLSAFAADRVLVSLEVNKCRTNLDFSIEKQTNKQILPKQKSL